MMRIRMNIITSMSIVSMSMRCDIFLLHDLYDNNDIENNNDNDDRRRKRMR